MLTCRRRSLLRTCIFIIILSLARAATVLSAELNNGVFEITLPVPFPDPAPVVQLYFGSHDHPVKPMNFEKITETNGPYSVDVYYFPIPEGERRTSVRLGVSRYVAECAFDSLKTFTYFNMPASTGAFKEDGHEIP